MLNQAGKKKVEEYCNLLLLSDEYKQKDNIIPFKKTMPIGNIERGTQDPSLSMAYRIARYFELSVYDIFPLKQNTASPPSERDAC